ARHFRDARHAFWLEGSGWGAAAMGRADSAREFRDWGSFAAWAESSVSAARRAAPWKGYRGGPVGQLSYELYRDTLGLPAPASGDPLARWLLPEGHLAFDREARKAYAAWE